MSLNNWNSRFHNVRNTQVETINGFQPTERPPVLFDRVITVTGVSNWLSNSIGIITAIYPRNIAKVRLMDDGVSEFNLRFNDFVVIERIRSHESHETQEDRQWNCKECTFKNHCCAWVCQICEYPSQELFPCSGKPMP